MARRLVLGFRQSGGTPGLYISKPGIDADFGAPGQMLFNSDSFQAMQFMQRGQVYLPTLPFSNTPQPDRYNSAPIYYPNFGYFPIVLLSMDYTGPTDWIGSFANIQIQYVSHTTANLIRTDVDKNSISPYINYAVLRGQVMQ